jgi:hypothetical protein
VRRCPRGADGGGRGGAHRGRKEAATMARITVRGGGGSAKDADEKSRKGGACGALRGENGGGRGREEERGRVGRLGGKRSGPSLKEHENF